MCVAAICLLRGGLVYILDGAAPIHGISSGDFHCCLSENEHTPEILPPDTAAHCFVLSSPASTVALHTEKIRAQYVLFKTFFDGFSELS